MCFDVLHSALLCFIVLFCSLPCLLCFIVLNRALLYYIVLNCAVRCSTVRYCAPLCATGLDCALFCFIVRYRALLCFTVLYRAVRCSTVLYCASLCGSGLAFALLCSFVVYVNECLFISTQLNFKYLPDFCICMSKLVKSSSHRCCDFLTAPALLTGCWPWPQAVWSQSVPKDYRAIPNTPSRHLLTPACCLCRLMSRFLTSSCPFCSFVVHVSRPYFRLLL